MNFGPHNGRSLSPEQTRARSRRRPDVYIRARHRTALQSFTFVSFLTTSKYRPTSSRTRTRGAGSPAAPGPSHTVAYFIALLPMMAASSNNVWPYLRNVLFMSMSVFSSNSLSIPSSPESAANQAGKYLQFCNLFPMLRILFFNEFFF